MDKELSVLLCSFLEKCVEGDLRLSVTFTDSAEVLELKDQIRVLEASRADLQRRCNAAEFEVGNSTVRFLRLYDYCRDNGIRIPKSLT